MKLYDKIILIILVAFFIVVYLVTDITFEMTTDYKLFENGLWVYVICVIITAYYCFKYYGPKKWGAYTSLLFASVFFWLGLLNTISKLKLLYNAAFGQKTELVVKIKSVKKEFTKRSFDHTEVTIPFNGHDIEFETSRTNFFALEHKNAIKVVIGSAGPDNYYITKVYWKPGEISTARYKYLKFWWSRNWFLPVLVVGFILAVIISVKFGKPAGHIYRQEFKTKKPVSFWRAMAIVTVVLLSVMLILYLGLITYVYIVHGGCANCKFW